MAGGKLRNGATPKPHITSENARELQKMGVAKRKQNQEIRASLQMTMDAILRKSIKKGAKVDLDDILSIAETDGKNISAQQAMAIAIIQKAMAGDVEAFKTIRDTLGEKPVDKVETSMTIEDYVKTHKVKF